MALTYPKSSIEYRENVFDGQISDENSNAALDMDLGFVCRSTRCNNFIYSTKGQPLLC